MLNVTIPDLEELPTVMTTAAFPFTLADLDGWVVQYKDGTVTRFILDSTVVMGGSGAGYHNATVAKADPYYSQGSLSGYCTHSPAAYPVFSHIFENDKGDKGVVDLYIADSFGAKAHYKEFDVVIDGGNVIYPYEPSQTAVLKGDPILVSQLKSHAMVEVLNPRILHIEWADRAEPDLAVTFWPALALRLEIMALSVPVDAPLKVLTVCQGGHGRSGSALTALMMVWSDYSPLDAITHLRAVHCPRAIESKVQHEYLNQLGDSLGSRPKNAHDAEDVKDFKARFMTLTSKFAKPYQLRLEKGVKK